MNGKTDAIYRYYLHGPLARVELGHEKLQGIDYAYTLQGWLKGINGSHLNPAVEIGQDGANGVGKDVMAYSLGYFSDDYKPVNAAAEAFQLKYGAETEDITGHALYNGNISHTTVALYQLPGTTPVGYTYRYDQLNRLVKQRQHALTAATTSWGLAQYTNDYKENIDYDGNGNILKYVRSSADGALMDTLSYFYPRNAASRLVNNRLRHVKDYVSTPAITSDIETQVDDNYLYDNIGNLIRDSKESITKIEWTVYGKIRKITKTGSSLEYAYDPAGNRVYKQETVGSTVNKTWYVRDAQGNVLGVYGNKNGDAVTYWKEQHLYGSSRLGMWMPDINIVGGTSSTPWNSPGNRRYELANHLGNVLSTISDAAKVDFYPIVENAQDYYPFGMMQPGRTYKRVEGSSYRYGFNGKENDNEVKGVGNQQDYGFRVYDPRLGRFLSVDPLRDDYPFYTPYQFAGNMPIQFVDLDGLEPGPPPSQAYAMNKSLVDDLMAGKRTPRVVNSARAGAVVTLTMAIALDAVFTKGWATRTLLLTQVGGLFEHNTAKSPEGKKLQEERFKDGAADLAITWGVGRILSAGFKVFKAPTEEAFEYMYRVQGGISKPRFVVDEARQNIGIAGDDMLFINIGQEGRALEFAAKRGEEAVILRMKITKSFADKIRQDAVPQNVGRLNPGKPQIVDPTKAVDQYGLPKEYFDDLLKNIDKKSIEIITKPTN
ncbi:hypothetical protein CCY01nite_07050 [Chitinophaga cymbidii]|uniref:RHS repeat-associated core domain-containing protein n=1 Tax=Chitinophaga cymbidii TaxID=1096750 RepID=A0A512RFG5_9BACT|nr:hypothetical protein CCY01nite_07050 [Chitinophaga cymbidii]